MENYVSEELEEIQEVKRTFAISEDLYQKMEQLSYWERITQKDILNEALAQYLSKKDIKPIPSSYKKIKRGRKPQ